MIEELHRFILVAKNGNVSKTAESIFITQSALSQSIKRLEKEFGTKLFVQKGKTLHITPDGTAILEIGNKILELWGKAKNPKSRETQKPTISLGLFDSAALRLGKYITQKEDKNYTLDLTISSSGKLLTQLQLGTIDVAICVFDNKNPLPKDLLTIKTFSEELIPVASQKFKVNIDKLPFILYNMNSHTRNQIDEAFIKQSIFPNVIAESTSVSFMKKLASLGTGIALLPEMYIETELKQKSLLKHKLPIIFKRTYSLLIRKNGQIDTSHPLIKELINHLE